MLRAVLLLCCVTSGCGSSRATHSPGDSSVPVAPDGSAAASDAMSSSDATSSSDAATADATAVGDAALAVDAGSTSTANTVSCYVPAAPATTCTLPTRCCFTNYDSQHSGNCTTAACSWGTISCDGPEDCTGGQRCCAHAMIDPNQGLMGYTLACQAGPCGAAPANQELCHAGTCSSGTCVSAYGNDNDLPRTLSICQ